MQVSSFVLQLSIAPAVVALIMHWSCLLVHELAQALNSGLGFSGAHADSASVTNINVNVAGFFIIIDPLFILSMTILNKSCKEAIALQQ